MRVIFFFQNVENMIYVSEMQQKVHQKIFVLNITAFELDKKKMTYYEENTCRRQ